MPIYSHSQLSVYEECPLKYKLCYRDRIKRDSEEVIEAFLGTMVHETLKKCYDDARLTKVNSPAELIAYYDNLWQQRWQDSIVITKRDLTPEHYQTLGQRMIETYYQRHAPFDADITIGTELRLNFSLDDANKYKLVGYIDRLSRTGDGTCQIHDYKTGGYLPSQAEADSDRQLGLYQIGVQKRWPDVQDVRLVWHYLAHDCELVSSRSEKSIAQLVADTVALIDEMESAEEFSPRESGACQWCDYPDLCPMRKHLFLVESLPAREYLQETGVALVNRFADLKARAADMGKELEELEEAILDYARREDVSVVRGSNCQVKVKFDQKLKFPGKNDPKRQELGDILVDVGKWLEVSQLDTSALVQVVENGLWDRGLISMVLKYGRVEETESVRLSRLRDEETDVA